MSFQYTPYTLPLIAAAGSSLVVALLAFRHRDHASASRLALLMGAATWWSVTYAAAISWTSLPGKLVAYKLMYAGVVVVPVAWVLFAIEYSGRLRRPSRAEVGALLVVPAATLLLVWTNGFHGLIWPAVDVTVRGSAVLMTNTHGPAFWGFTAYSYLLLAVGTVLLLEGTFVGTEDVYRGQAAAIVAASLVPWAANVLFLSGATGVWDPTAFGFIVSGMLLTAAIFRGKLLRVVPMAREVAREEIVESMREGVIVLDATDRVVDCNPAAEAIIGEAPSAAIGRPIDAVLPVLAEARDAAGGADEGRREITLADEETYRHYEVEVTPLARGYGAIAGELLTLRDVTDRKRRQREIERHRQQLSVLNRVLRHDIRNAMNVILGNAEDIRSGTGADGDHLDVIVEKGEEIVTLSEKVRRLERTIDPIPGDATTVDVTGTVRQVVADVSRRYPEADIEVELPDGAEAVAIDLLDSGLRNLIENAIQHSDREAPAVTVSVTKRRGWNGGVGIHVADDGPGLPAPERDVIEAGTESAVKHSSGLGLWIAYWIARESGGDLAYAENEPRGSVLTVRLPLAESDRDAA